MSNISDIILASSSQTRKALMDRLGLTYRIISPDIDESPKVKRMRMIWHNV